MISHPVHKNKNFNFIFRSAIITVRNVAWQCFYTYLSFCSREGGGAGQTPPGQTPPSWADTPTLGRHPCHADTPTLGRSPPVQTILGRHPHPGQTPPSWADTSPTLGRHLPRADPPRRRPLLWMVPHPTGMHSCCLLRQLNRTGRPLGRILSTFQQFGQQGN